MKISLVRLRNILYFALLIDTIFTPITLAIGQISSNYSIFSNFFKFPFLLTFISSFIIVIKTFKYRLTIIELLLIFFGLVGILKGILLSQFNYYYISHCYSFMLAIFGFRAGRVFDIKEFINKFMKYKNLIIVVLFLFSIFYFIFYRIGIINYWGVSSNLGLILIILVSLNLKGRLITVLSIFLLGKRTIILTSLITYFLAQKAKFKNIFYSIIISFSFFILALRFGLLKRFIMPIELFINNGAENLDFQNFLSNVPLNILFSGRLYEIDYVIKRFSNFSDWVFGIGFGGQYESPVSLFMQNEMFFKHYSHFSLLSISMIYGFVFSTIIYVIGILLILKLAFEKNLNKEWRVVYLCFTFIFIASFAGATAMVDSKFWILFGLISKYKWKQLSK